MKGREEVKRNQWEPAELLMLCWVSIPLEVTMLKEMTEAPELLSSAQDTFS